MDIVYDSIEEKVDDRRLFDRFHARFPAKVKDSRETFGHSLSLRDASAQGAKFHSHEPFNLREHLTIEIKIPDGTEPLVLRGDVVWVHELSAADWEIGLKFREIRFSRLAHLYESCLNIN